MTIEDDYIDELPDVFGHAIFCDDIRDEIGGKKSYIGVYSLAMFIHDPFPVVVPKFGIAISIFQKRSIFNPNATLLVFLPGDEETPSYTIEIEENAPGESLKQVDATADELREPSRLVRMNAGFVLTPLSLKAEGSIRIRVLTGGRTVRLGRLNVRLSKRGLEATAQAANKS